jgi:hypothetical protein
MLAVASGDLASGVTGDPRLLDKLARQMVYLDRLINDARRRGEYDYAEALLEQRASVQQQRSALMRHDVVDDE